MNKATPLTKVEFLKKRLVGHIFLRSLIILQKDILFVQLMPFEYILVEFSTMLHQLENRERYKVNI